MSSSSSSTDNYWNWNRHKVKKLFDNFSLGSLNTVVHTPWTDQLSSSRLLLKGGSVQQKYSTEHLLLLLFRGRERERMAKTKINGNYRESLLERIERKKRRLPSSQERSDQKSRRSKNKERKQAKKKIHIGDDVERLQIDFDYYFSCCCCRQCALHTQTDKRRKKEGKGKEHLSKHTPDNTDN